MTALGIREVPSTDTELPLWTAMDTLWYKNADSLGSPVAREILRPKSERKSTASSPTGPRVSTATTENACVWRSPLYFFCLSVSAFAAAAPALNVVDGKCERARVSGMVTSQATHFPMNQGTTVQPSGRSLESGRRPVGSRLEGNPALTQARKIMSLMAECLL